jgi:transposase
MKRFIEGEDRHQVTLLPECLDDYIGEDNPVRVVDAFVEELDLYALGFEGVDPAATGRPSYHPSVLLKLYIYGYLNRIQSSRRLEREAQRNVELMWLTGRLAPDFKTIADFRHDNGAGIRNVCRRFVGLCRDLKLFSHAIVAIDGSKFKAVNSRDRRLAFDEASITSLRHARMRPHFDEILRVTSAIASSGAGRWANAFAAHRDPGAHEATPGLRSVGRQDRRQAASEINLLACAIGAVMALVILVIERQAFQMRRAGGRCLAQATGSLRSCPTKGSRWHSRSSGRSPRC